MRDTISGHLHTWQPSDSSQENTVVLNEFVRKKLKAFFCFVDVMVFTMCSELEMFLQLIFIRESDRLLISHIIQLVERTIICQKRCA